MNNNPVATYLKLADFIREEDSQCRQEVNTICHGTRWFLTDDQENRRYERYLQMFDRITAELKQAGINPKTLFPKGSKWRYDRKSERIMPLKNAWPDIESLLKHIEDSWNH